MTPPVQLADDVICRDFGGEILLLRLGDGAFFAIPGNAAVRFRALLDGATPDDSLTVELLDESLIRSVPMPACNGGQALIALGRTTDFSDVTPIRPGAAALS